MTKHFHSNKRALVLMIVHNDRNEHELVHSHKDDSCVIYFIHAVWYINVPLSIKHGNLYQHSTLPGIKALHGLDEVITL